MDGMAKKIVKNQVIVNHLIEQMENKQSENSSKKLLNRLQEDSWQLELLVSGFVIFGLFYSLDPIERMFLEAGYNGNQFKYNISLMSFLAIQILIFNLIVHVILRSLWIGTLGLRYISSEIEIDTLNYSKLFTHYLKKKVGSFDDYIEKLERLSSIIFAITFLLIFYLMSTFIVLKLMTEIDSLIENDTSFLGIIYNTILIFLVIGSGLTFFDFITLGLLKKNKWISAIYFPFYWVFSFLTLSFLYRPLVYNLLDNKFGRRISWILVPFYTIIVILFSLNYQKSNYITDNIIKELDEGAINERNYEDFIIKSKSYTDVFSIQSKVISTHYLNIKIAISDNIDDIVFEFNEGLKPDKDHRGYKISKIEIEYNHNENLADSLRTAFLKTFQDIHRFKIDSTIHKPEFVISKSRSNLWFETFIGIKDLEEGKHTLDFMRYKHKDTDSLISIKKIPFWYYKK